MGQVTQNGEQHVLIIVIPFGKIFGKGKISKKMTMQKLGWEIRSEFCGILQFF
jgi:hypothetical protein